MSSLSCKTFCTVEQHTVLRCTGRVAFAGGVKRSEGGLNGNGGVWAAEKVALAPGCRDGTEQTGAVSSEYVLLNNALLS